MERGQRPFLTERYSESKKGRCPLNRMKAIRVHEFGDPEVLKIEDVDPLTPQKGQVVVQVKAIGVNPVDTYIRSGSYSSKVQCPFTPGFDGAGIIKRLSKDVKTFKVGQRVFVAGSLTGTYAEEVRCLKNQVYPLPADLSFEQGASIGIPYLTAYRALMILAYPKAKKTVLIHGASGGVGLACVQLAKKARLRIIATAGTEKGCNLLREQGAHLILNHKKNGYLNEIKNFTKDKGVDIILEMLANVNLGEDLKILALQGRVIVIGSRGPVSINPRDLMVKEASIKGLVVLNTIEKERIKIYKTLIRGLAAQELNPVIGKEFTLKDAPLAHRMILESGAYGKIILIP